MEMRMRTAESPVTVERLDRAIRITAQAMIDYPDVARDYIWPHLKALEAERDRLIQEGDPLEYAKRVIERRVA
jgi:hypothetical protein